VTVPMLCLRPGCGEISPLTWDRVLDVWVFDPWMCGVLVLLAAGYGYGVQQRLRRGVPWPVGRSVAFGAGLAMFALAVFSFVAGYSLTVFWVRALQNVLLLMTVPMLLAFGAPVTLLAEETGRFGTRCRALIGSRPMRVLMFPAVVSALLLVTPYLLYFTGWYELTLTNAFFDESLHVELVAVGFLYFWSRARLDPVPHAYPHMISVMITTIENIADAVLAVVLWLDKGLVAGHYYTALNMPWVSSPQWGYSPLHWAQALGGGVFMVVGDVCSLPFLGALWTWLRREESAADRDEQDLLVPAAATSGDRADAEMFEPWWLHDSRFAMRFGGPTDAEGPED
jgi:cytochrome c oxidase assembly factor CtaG